VIWWRRGAAALCAALPLMGALAAPAGAGPGGHLRPHRLVIQVVPAMAGVAFALDGRSFASDARGLATITVIGAGKHRLSVRVPAQEHGLRFDFQRWSGGHGDDFGTARNVVLGGLVTRLVAGFGSASPVRLRFADEQGEAIPSRVVQTVTLKDDSGGQYRVAADGLHWLPARRIVRENSGRVSARPLAYSVEGVTVSGANAVFRSQQRFRPAPNGTWTIRLRFYEMHVGVLDAAFRFPVGSALQVRYPDGRVHRLDLDERSSARSGRLARGNYQLKVQGPGISWWVPVSLSRTQEVRLVFVSWLDLAVAVLALVLIVLGLPLLGRRLRRRRAVAVARAEVAAEEHEALEQAGP
jgi:hypothetical protein